MVMEKIRLSKVMADRGLCSRREADAYISAGWVRVDGVTVSVLGTRIDPSQRIELSPEAQRHSAAQVTILLNKPVGYVSNQPEKGYPPAVVLIRPENHWSADRDAAWSPKHLQGLAVAGRLDIDSQGLLVFTQDGRLARRLIGEGSEVDKEYSVRVSGRITPEVLERLRHGLHLDGRALKPAGVEPAGPGMLRFVLREGRKRQIRRMAEAVGLTVTHLRRVRIGRVDLGDLPTGQWRYLGPQETF